MSLPPLQPRQGGTGLTSLSALPISTAQQTALDLKADKTQLATPAVQRFSVADGNLTAGQTTISVSAYTPGTVMVFENGNKLPTNAYTATSGTTVVLVDPVQAPDVIEVLSWLMSGVQNAAPISHQHSTADLTGPALPVVLGGLGNGTGDASALKVTATSAVSGETTVALALKDTLAATIRPEQMAIDATGVADAGPGLTKLITKGMVTGRPVRIDKGVYLLKTSVAVTLTSSIEVICHPEAVFVADATLNNKMVFLQIDVANVGVSVKWIGGTFDCRALVNSPAGQAWDCLTVSEYGHDIHIERVKFLSVAEGDETTAPGGDSHLFLVGKRITLVENTHVGAWDCGVYASARTDATYGESLISRDCHYWRCTQGINAKRGWLHFATIGGSFVKCTNGIAGAEVSPLMPGSRQIVSGVYFKKTVGNAIIFRVADGGAAVGNIIEDFGHNLDGTVVANQAAISLQGSKNCTIVGNTIRMVDWATHSSHSAIQALSRTLDGTTYNATDNIIQGNNISGVYTGCVEADTSQNNNHWGPNNISGATTSYNVQGAASTVLRRGSGFELDSATVSIGGKKGSEALRGTRGTSTAQFVNVAPAVSGAGSGPTLSFSSDTDPDVSGTIICKGTGTLLIGGAAGAEVLRVSSSVGSGSNAVQVVNAAAGSNPMLTARGADTNSSLQLRGKGTGGAILLDGGSVKKIEVNSTGVGFFAATPVAKQTVSAALVTDGTATNAAMATAINALRTALLNYGLVS